jgi:hypothetical protein
MALVVASGRNYADDEEIVVKKRRKRPADNVAPFEAKKVTKHSAD